MYLLDTNVISELRKTRPHGAVLAWIDKLRDDDLYLSAVTLGEIQAGIEITREQDKEKAAALDIWANQLIETRRVLPMTGEIFQLWAKLMHRQSDSLYEDAMIAATAITHKLTLATRNLRDFQKFPVNLINPFDTP